MYVNILVNNNVNIVKVMINEQKDINQRKIRGIAIISKGDKPLLVDEKTYIVPSQSSNSKYHVSHTQEWSCDCPDFQTRGKICKHIHAVQFWLNLNSKTKMDEFFDKKTQKEA